MEDKELIPNLFRSEHTRIVAVLSKQFGIGFVGSAEDIAGDTFLLAAETWGLKGLPKNPRAWLYTVAKNKAIDHLRRAALFDGKIAPAIRQDKGDLAELEIDLSSENIRDSQLKMMFAICHPCISAEAQVGLSLNILCGFGVAEIADAFLSSKEVIYKRLARAKERLRLEKVPIELPPDAAISQRLETVLTTIYLLFSEGYYSSSHNAVLRKELCLEALRLNLMLVENDSTSSPSANALLSLMCFHASRFEARTNARGEIVLYEDQDETLWNRELIAKGQYYLAKASAGKQISKYHIEAAIAYWHTQKEDTIEKWESVLQLYNRLLQLEYSPMAALNRTYALSKANSRDEAIHEALKLQLTDNYFYFALLARLHQNHDKNRAVGYWQSAEGLARSKEDKRFIQEQICLLLNT